ncbi:MAG: patatin-like phospholipase family protein [Solirubrobacterales bacterium]|nr:patatin-like phospholipase family protein [Solirubrobacterales bacterium]
MRPLRISLTLSGGASLGAYEAGAAAGMAVAARRLQREGQETTIDAIGGASAGSLVGLFLAHSLLEGIDPVDLMYEAWVERVTLKMLRSTSPTAPLSFDELRERAPELLDREQREPSEHDGEEALQDRALAFHVCLTNLRGVTYPIRGLRRDEPITGATYADWGRFELKPGGGIEQLLEPEQASPFDFVLASAASPGGFAPQLLDRSRDEEGYRSRGIQNFPESGSMWYTDGGLVASQPLGRIMAAGRSLHGPEPDATHLSLLIDPRSEVSMGGEEWSDTDNQLSWTSGLARALGILSQQELFEDLRKIEKDNSRIVWARELVEALGPHLPDEAAPDLREFLERIESQRDEMRADEPHREDDRHGSGAESASDLLGEAVAEIGGLSGKQPISIDVISPLLLTGDGKDIRSLLAGEFMGDFGGFLSHDLRASDFDLGYESTIAWLKGGLTHCEVSDAAIEAAVECVESRRLHDPEEVKAGEAEVGDLSLGDRWELVRLGLHTARVLGSGALDVREKISDPIGRLLKRLPGQGD